jgi:hypothetical protein
MAIEIMDGMMVTQFLDCMSMSLKGRPFPRGGVVNCRGVETV